MLPRPATMITAVVVTFALAGVMKLSTRSMTVAPQAAADSSREEGPAQLDSSRYQSEISDLETVLYQEAPPSQAAPASTVDPSMIEDLLRAIDAIEDLADRGRDECEQLGEPFYDFEQPGAEGDAHIEKWNDFARTWDEDVTEVATRLPSPPTWDADPALTAAYQDVTWAIRELRDATM
ncbi:MAG: hypothetical protein L0Z51_07600, partial [Candidatus Latescibacteria bacterium]|nr:hypothetical protein [Candidatus Latescibacterota bacterium]